MQKSRINLQEVRNFSDSITATFLFIKQEFKSLFIGFATIILPLIFIDLFFKSFALKDALHLQASFGDPDFKFSTLFWSSFSSLIVVYGLIVFVNSYLKIYADRFRSQNEAKITVSETWKVMCRYLGKTLILGVIYLMIVGVGCVALVIPGIYLSILFVFAYYFLIVRDQRISESFGNSVELVKGQWWYLFGFLFVMQLIVSMLSYVFSLPQIILMVKSMFTHEVPGTYELTFGMLIANLGKYFLYIILVVGTGVCFFSSLERKEHVTLLDKIQQIGSNEQTEKSEDIL